MDKLRHNFGHDDAVDMCIYWSSQYGVMVQPCLGGSGKTLMFVNINPEEESLQETVCSLRFAAKVNACETSAKGGAKRHVQQSGGASGCICSGQAPLPP